jgi:hypothetical protein
MTNMIETHVSSRRYVALKLTVALLLVCIPATGQAQEKYDEFRVERFQLAMDGDGLLNVDWAAVPDHMNWNVATWLAFADDPLVIYDSADQDQRLGSMVGQRVAVGLAGTISLWGRVQFGLSTEVVGFQQSKGPVEDFQMPPESIPGAGLGDLRLAPKIRLLGGPLSRLHIAVIPAVTVPLGGPGGYLRETGPTLAPEAAVSFADGLVRLAVNVGYKIRGQTAVGNLEVNDEVFVRAGGGYRFGNPYYPTMELAASIAGATAASSPFSNSNQNAFEAMVGGSRAVAESTHVFVGGGIGLTTGFGTPDWRVIAGTRFRSGASDRDRDGLADAVDQCLTVAEDVDGFEDTDGCPDPDNDSDGLVDARDRCPDKAEDPDGFEDTDGCPETDNDKDGLADGDDKCPDIAEDFDGDEDTDGCPEERGIVRGKVTDSKGAPLRATLVIEGGDSPIEFTSDVDGTFERKEVPRGQLKIVARADGYHPAEKTIKISGGESTEVAMSLAVVERQGQLRVLVRSFKGSPLAATIAVEGVKVKGKTDSDGLFEVDLPEGEYSVLIKSPGFRDKTSRVKIKKHAVTIVNVDMKKQPRRR